ncbi:MAG TPA: adenylate/guanylate cyclase domain-containing protein [Bacteroidales bacterium]|nr:adenylate/guanylate cyclase domain-containing protein [Bacteroidales bacterium]
MEYTIEELLKQLEEQKKQNRELLQRNKELIEQNNLLNDEIERLRIRVQHESADKKSLRFKMATVLFADIRGFTKLSDEADPQKLIDELDRFYFIMDGIIKKYNIEKVSSVGDTIMLVGGIPKKNRTNPIEMVLAAMEIQHEFEKFQEEIFGHGKRIWEINMGIHSGPVTVSISGKKKESYEVKGETVNIASRIEAASENGKIIISEQTRELVSAYFRCRYLGKLPVKYVGDMNLYNVNGYLPEFSADNKGLLPNQTFITKLQLIRYDDLEEFMLDKLERELPKYLYYHNLKHTMDVVIQAEIIGRGEGISEEEMLLLKTAALFHDSGQTVQSKGHEQISAQIAQEILPKYGYSIEQINIICDIIKATELPPKPQTLLQNIICDADLDYLGRSDFIPVSNTLYKELHEQKLIGSMDDWNRLQIKFLSAHQYFTETANKLREVNKQTQIERLKQLIED